MHRTTGSFVSPDSSPPEPNLPLWESLMRQAVSDERAHHAALARSGYERALARHRASSAGRAASRT